MFKDPKLELNRLVGLARSRGDNALWLDAGLFNAVLHACGIAKNKTSHVDRMEVGGFLVKRFEVMPR